jgi:hypothetical protein
VAGAPSLGSRIPKGWSKADRTQIAPHRVSIGLPNTVLQSMIFRFEQTPEDSRAQTPRSSESPSDDQSDSAKPVSLPEWIDQEAKGRREELQCDPSIALDHDEVWRRIRRRHR